MPFMAELPAQTKSYHLSVIYLSIHRHLCSVTSSLSLPRLHALIFSLPPFTLIPTNRVTENWLLIIYYGLAPAFPIPLLTNVHVSLSPFSP